MGKVEEQQAGSRGEEGGEVLTGVSDSSLTKKKNHDYSAIDS